MGLDDRAVLDRPNGLTGRPVECKNEALFRVLDHRGDLHAVHRQIHQNGRRRQVVVPLVAAVDLEVPPPLACLDVERQEGAAEEVVARPMARVRLDRRGVRHDVDEPQLRVGGRGSPRRHVARPHPGVVLPRLVPELPGPRDHVEFPEELAGFGVVAHDVAGDVLDPGLAIAGLVPHEHHNDPVHHDRRRRAGDHTELPRHPIVGVVRSLVPALPLAPAIQELRYQIDDAGLLEVIQRYGRTPVLQGPPSLGVERPKEEGGGRDIDHSAAVHFGVGDPFAIGPPGRAQEPDGFRLAKHPYRLARVGVDRHHLPARRGHGVDHSVGVDRRGPGKVVEVGAEVVTLPDPVDFEVLEVAGVDLVEGGRAGMAGVAAEVTPFSVLGAW